MPITPESQNALRNILLPHLKDLSTKRGVFFITEEKGGGALPDGTWYGLFLADSELEGIDEKNRIIFYSWKAYNNNIKGPFFAGSIQPGNSLHRKCGYYNITSTLKHWCGWKKLNQTATDALFGEVREPAGIKHTFDSLCSFLGEQNIVSQQQIEQIRSEIVQDKLTKKDFKLHALASLSAEQDPIIRQNVKTAIILDGLPGSGKTTTAIKALTKHCFYDDEGNRLQTPYSWLYVVPNEILKDYIQTAFIKEQIPAPKESILLWSDIRSHLLRDVFGLINAQHPYVCNDNADTTAPETKKIFRQTCQATNFEQWQEQASAFVENQEELQQQKQLFISVYRPHISLISVALGVNEDTLTKKLTTSRRTAPFGSLELDWNMPIENAKYLDSIGRIADLEIYVSALARCKTEEMLQQLRPSFHSFYEKCMKTTQREIIGNWNYLAPENERISPSNFEQLWENLLLWAFVCKIITDPSSTTFLTQKQRDNSLDDTDEHSQIINAGFKYLLKLQPSFSELEDIFTYGNKMQLENLWKSFHTVIFPNIETDTIPENLRNRSYIQLANGNISFLYKIQKQADSFPVFKQQLEDFILHCLEYAPIEDSFAISKKQCQEEWVVNHSEEWKNKKEEWKTNHPDEWKEIQSECKKNYPVDWEERTKEMVGKMAVEYITTREILWGFQQIYNHKFSQLINHKFRFVLDWFYEVLKEIHIIRQTQRDTNHLTPVPPTLQTLVYNLYDKQQDYLLNVTIPALWKAALLLNIWNKRPNINVGPKPTLAQLISSLTQMIASLIHENEIPGVYADACCLLLLTAAQQLTKEQLLPNQVKELLEKCSYHKIIVDEVTDFSPIQIQSLRFLSPNGLFMCGDLMQRTTTIGLTSWEDLQQPGTLYKELTTGYRQNPHLLKIANDLYDRNNPDAHKKFSSDFLDAEYEEPEYTGKLTFEQEIEFIKNKTYQIYQKQPSIAVFVTNPQERKKYAEALRHALGGIMQIRECDNGQTGQENEVRVVTYDAIKGLEFEITFLTGLEGTPLSLRDKFLYLALTRAKRNLYIIGDLPEQLQGIPNLKLFHKVS